MLAWMQQRQTLVENTLIDIFNQADLIHSHDLIKAVRYSSLDGGKRIRPLLLFAAAHIFSVPDIVCAPAACALELIHCYSLIHDDLPAMDDDDLRRGRPSCHVKFDESTAILAGDLMQPLAFSVLANDTLELSIRLKLVKILAEASQNMVYGQALDMHFERQSVDVATLKTIHLHKTAHIIQATLLMGGTIGHADDAQMVLLKYIGKNLGLAFQIQDDILDATANSKALGKPAGSDKTQEKNTYVSVLGLKAAKNQADRHYQLAKSAIMCFESDNMDVKQLMFLADFLINRQS